eukprot:3477261-Prymnesium_polylepis.1
MLRSAGPQRSRVTLAAPVLTKPAGAVGEPRRTRVSIAIDDEPIEEIHLHEGEAERARAEATEVAPELLRCETPRGGVMDAADEHVTSAGSDWAAKRMTSAAEGEELEGLAEGTTQLGGGWAAKGWTPEADQIESLQAADQAPLSPRMRVQELSSPRGHSPQCQAAGQTNQPSASVALRPTPPPRAARSAAHEAWERVPPRHTRVPAPSPSACGDAAPSTPLRQVEGAVEGAVEASGRSHAQT